jgi:hypothetical protein
VVLGLNMVEDLSLLITWFEAFHEFQEYASVHVRHLFWPLIGQFQWFSSEFYGH